MLDVTCFPAPDVALILPLSHLPVRDSTVARTRSVIPTATTCPPEKIMHSLVKYVAAISFFTSISGLAADQAAPTKPSDRTTSNTVSAASSPTAPAEGLAEVEQVVSQLRELVAAQSRQLEQQRLALQQQRKDLDAVQFEVQTSASPRNADLADARPAEALTAAASELVTYHPPRALTAQAYAHPQLNPTGPESSAPLSINIGNAKFTPGGWVDFTSIYRTTDVGSGLGTSFQSIPYSNTVQGGLSENRFTAQSSRLSLRADEVVGGNKIFGYVEADFNGALASNGFVSTNSDSFRMRVYFLNLSHHKWDLLGGQSWSLLTPNRRGMSPFLSEIFNTTHLDTNYQVGLTYARQTQLRAVYHFNDGLAFGLSLENPEQFSGSATTFPSLFSNAETDVNSSSSAGGGTSTPNLHPDVIAKVAGDKTIGGRNFHVEAAGLLTGVQVFTPASVTKGATATDDREGGGASVNVNLEVAPHFHLIADSYWSDGGGRYIGGLGPGFVVAQHGAVTSPFSAQLVHSGSGIGGFEWRATPATVLSAYYGGAYFQRVSSVDPGSKTPALVGYGFAGSANSNNRAIQEGSFASVTTLWKNEQYGALQIVTQTSYVTRAPWYVAPGAPRNAHTFMEFANVRFVLP
ncbi:MAG TPA: hypothetical protein VGD59_14820 [Acidisarcina sp.]